MKGLLTQADGPLYPEIIWEAPQTRTAAKKLLIIGGHSEQVERVQKSYNAALQAGIGEARIVLPDKLKPVIGDVPNILYVSSTLSGSLDKSANNEIASFINESDGLLIAGGLSKHPHTTILIENILLQTAKPLFLSEDIISLTSHKPELMYAHPQRVSVASTQGYIKLANLLKLPVEIIRDDNLLSKIKLLNALKEQTGLGLVLIGQELLVCIEGRTSATPLKLGHTADEVAGWMVTYYLQHTQKFKALTTAAWQLQV